MPWQADLAAAFFFLAFLLALRGEAATQGEEPTGTGAAGTSSSSMGAAAQGISAGGSRAATELLETVLQAIISVAPGGINAQGEDGRTALHEAAARGDVRTVRLLLDRGAAVNIQDEHGVTPLTLACAAQSEGVIQLLNAAGAVRTALDGFAVASRPSRESPNVSLLQQLLSVPQATAASWHNGAADKSVETCARLNTLVWAQESWLQGVNGVLGTPRRLLGIPMPDWQQEPERPFSRDFTALHCAMILGDDELASLLFGLLAQAALAEDDKGCTLAHYLWIPVPHSLLSDIKCGPHGGGGGSCGAPHLPRGSSSDGSGGSSGSGRALFPAETKIWQRRMEILIMWQKKGGDVNSTGRLSLPPLHMAVQRECLHAVQILLQLSAKIDAAPDGATALYMCVGLPPSPVKQAILQALLAAEADVHVLYKGVSPLRVAVLLGDVSSARMLLEAGADPDALIEGAGSMLVAAAAAGDAAMVKVHTACCWQWIVHRLPVSVHSLRSSSTMVGRVSAAAAAWQCSPQRQQQQQGQLNRTTQLLKTCCSTTQIWRPKRAGPSFHWHC